MLVAVVKLRWALSAKVRKHTKEPIRSAFILENTYVNIIYALGSAHVKYDVWIEVDLLPFYSTSSVEQNGRVYPNTKVPFLIDSYVELYVYQPNLIIRFGTCKVRRLNRALVSCSFVYTFMRYLLHLLLFITRKYAFICVKRRPTALRYIH